MKLLGKLFFRTLLSAPSHMMLFSPFFRSVSFAASNQFIWWSNDKLGEGFHKLVLSCDSHGNQVDTSLSSCAHPCTDLGISIAGEVEEKEALKNLLEWSKYPFM